MSKAQKEFDWVKYILETAENHYDMVLQWKKDNYSCGTSASLGIAAGYYNRCEALVELVEVWDCGSKGGFGEGFSESHAPKGGRILENRLDYLTKKYLGRPFSHAQKIHALYSQ